MITISYFNLNIKSRVIEILLNYLDNVYGFLIVLSFEKDYLHNHHIDIQYRVNYFSHVNKLK